MIVARSSALLMASIFIVFLSWFVYNLMSDGLAANMMRFESEPSQGWDYWRWYFIKHSLGGVFVAAAIILALAGLVMWGWISLVRDLTRQSDHRVRSRDRVSPWI